MCEYPHPKGKMFLLMLQIHTKIFVRRGGPNYQTSLKISKKCGEGWGLGMEVFGSETHITAIVSMALLESDKDPKKS
jgi:ATP-citrate lyase beta-subunit